MQTNLRRVTLSEGEQIPAGHIHPSCVRQTNRPVAVPEKIFVSYDDTRFFRPLPLAPQNSRVILSEQSESKDLRITGSAKQTFGVKIPRFRRSTSHNVPFFALLRKIPPVPWLLLSPQRRMAFVGSPGRFTRNDAFLFLRMTCDLLRNLYCKSPLRLL